MFMIVSFTRVMATAALQSKAPAELLEAGDQLGRYRVVRMTGKGGMGAVYEAVDEVLGRRVALKLLHPRYTADDLMLRRFFNEARAANLADHPGIVQITEAVHLPGGPAYLVMEFLAGITLSMLLRQGPLDEARTRALGAQVAAALAAVHVHGIIHRDLKPSNVMLVPDTAMPDGTRVKVVDFGIARLSPSGDGLTATGVILGTALYMAPEQCQASKQVDTRADVYALGALLFHALAGRPPFIGHNDVVIATQHLCTPPPPLRHLAPQVSESLAQLIERMLAKDPEQRPGMVEVRQLLEEGGGARPIAAQGPGTEVASAPLTSAEDPWAEERGRRSWPLVLLGVGVLMVVLVMAVRLLQATPPAPQLPVPVMLPPAPAPSAAPPLSQPSAPAANPRARDKHRRVLRGHTPTPKQVSPAPPAPPHATPLID